MSDIQYCEQHKRHYHTKWGCSSCPTLQETKIKKLEADVAAWKEAWYQQRQATGRMAWQYLIVRKCRFAGLMGYECHIKCECYTLVRQ